MNKRICTVDKGFVLMLDALGIKNIDVCENVSFLNIWLDLKSDLKVIEKECFYINGIKIQHRTPNTFIFGDTILCIWDFDDYSYDIAGLFFSLAHFSAKIIKIGIEKGILLRGAISVGKYSYVIEDHLTSVIGPAISDVASWYESIESIGIITTPHCHINVPVWLETISKIEISNSHLLHGIEDYIENEKIEKSFKITDLIEIYKHEIKNNFIELYTIKWPLLVYQEEVISCNNWLYKNLSKCKIPKGVEKKYFNSIEYFNNIITSLKK